jgi:hypothetical protein
MREGERGRQIFSVVLEAGMKPEPSNPSSEPKLPPASRDLLGCLFFPGCLGSVVFVILALACVAHAAGLIYALVTGEPFKPFPIQQTPREWLKLALIVFSWYACSAIRDGKRRPWVFWISTLALCGWIYFVATSDGARVTFHASDTTEQRIENGRWFTSALFGLVLLRFTLSRKNREYFGVSRER